MTVLGIEITTKETVKYLEIILDTKLTFFLHIKVGSAKATCMTTVLSRLMSNMSGARQNKRQLFMCRLFTRSSYTVWRSGSMLRFGFYMHSSGIKNLRFSRRFQG